MTSYNTFYFILRDYFLFQNEENEVVIPNNVHNEIQTSPRQFYYLSPRGSITHLWIVI